MKQRVMKSRREIWFDGFDPTYGAKVVVLALLALIAIPLFTKEIEVCEKCKKRLEVE